VKNVVPQDTLVKFVCVAVFASMFARKTVRVCT
jgi:hypothetical protein